jgi:hypothetical protein
MKGLKENYTTKLTYYALPSPLEREDADRQMGEAYLAN